MQQQQQKGGSDSAAARPPPPEMLRMRHPSCPVIRPQSIPSFEIPRRPRSVDRGTPESSFHRRRTESLHLMDRDLLANKFHPGLRRRNTLSATKMTEIVSNDPGYDLSLSLRHTPQAVTSYGFPRIVISPTTTRKESLFHDISSSSSRSHHVPRVSRRDSSTSDHDTWQCLSRPRCDSGISGISDLSDPSTTKSRTSTFSSISEYESLPSKERGEPTRARLERKYSGFGEDTNLNDWGYSSDSTTPGEETPDIKHRRFSADTILKNPTVRQRMSNNAVEETERSELLKQLHALCIKQQAGHYRDMGEVEYWLRYDFSRQTLKVLVLRAENVGGRSSSVKVSTYVRVTLKTDTSISQQTKVVKHTRDPIYDHEMVFPLEPVDVHFATLQVRVFRQRNLTKVLGGPVFLGMVSTRLHGLLVSPMKRIREDLGDEPEEGDPMRMNLSVCYKPRRKKLEVTIVKVADLPRSNLFGLPDTEVKVKVSQITDGEVKTFACKTKTKRWNANPVFKEAFSFPVSDIQNLRDGLSVTCTVVCQDHLRKNKSYGKVGLGLSSTQESEREHWKDVLSNPGFPCNRWHNLVEGKATS